MITVVHVDRYAVETREPWRSYLTPGVRRQLARPSLLDSPPSTPHCCGPCPEWRPSHRVSSRLGVASLVMDNPHPAAVGKQDLFPEPNDLQVLKARVAQRPMFIAELIVVDATSPRSLGIGLNWI